MLVLITSPDAILKRGVPDRQIADVFKATKAAGNPVALISNSEKPVNGSQTPTLPQFFRSRYGFPPITLMDRLHVPVRLGAPDREGLAYRHEGLALQAAADHGDERFRQVREIAERLVADLAPFPKAAPQQMGMIDPALIAACRCNYICGASTLWHRHYVRHINAYVKTLCHILVTTLPPLKIPPNPRKPLKSRDLT